MTPVSLGLPPHSLLLCFSLSFLCVSHSLSASRLQLNNQLTNSSGAGEAEGPLRQEGCPGQTFQVSALLSHLQDASASPSDIMLQPYLSSWDELVRWEHAHKKHSVKTCEDVLRRVKRNTARESRAKTAYESLSINHS